MINHDLSPCRPDYDGGSLVNLMASLGNGLGAPRSPYAPLAGFPAERLAAARRVVLLVIDGLGEELLRHLGPDSALAACHAGTMTSVYPPTTATAVTTLLSGRAPQQHGLTGWFVHLRRLGTVAAVLPFVSRFDNRPLERPGLSIGEVLDPGSFFAGLPLPSLLLQPARIADSAFSRLAAGPAAREGFDSLAAFAARLQRCVSGEGQAGYVYAYWSELDHLSHVHGPSSPEVAAHFRALDAALAPVLAACADSGTLLIATADHGFLDSGEQERVNLRDYPALESMLSLPLSGEPRSAFCFVQAGCREDFAAAAGELLADVARVVPSGQLIDEGWYGPGPAHPELRARCGDFTLQMLGRHTLRDRLAGEPDIIMKGMHGGITAAEQIVPLLVAGP